MAPISEATFGLIPNRVDGCQTRNKSEMSSCPHPPLLSSGAETDKVIH